MSDDIDHIESQNKGLQVQTSNQRALLSELDQLLVSTSAKVVDLLEFFGRIPSTYLKRISLPWSKRISIPKPESTCSKRLQ